MVMRQVERGAQPSREAVQGVVGQASVERVVVGGC